MSLSLTLTTVLVLLSTRQAETSSDIRLRFKALRFTQEPSSFVQFVPDFSRYTHAISACVWVKSLLSASYPTVFHYGGGDLAMMDNGDYICIFHSCMDLESKFSVSKGTWYHTCVTWQLSTRTHKYYVNGQLVGSQQTAAGRTLRTGGTLTLGNWGGNSRDHEFGGEMLYLNFYAKELSESEVREMANNGMFADLLTDRHKEVRLVKWEDMVRKTRSGRVTEVDIFEDQANKMTELETSLNETTKELAESQQALETKTETVTNLTQELGLVTNQLNNTILQLNSTLLALTNVSTELNRTSTEVQEISTRLNQTELDLRRATQELEMYNNSRNKWDWEIFKSEQYINTTITAEQAEQLRTSWDSVARKHEIYSLLYFCLI